MVKTNVSANSFNAGEFSALVAGRTDLNTYDASSQIMQNVISPPQGPAIGRSGTKFNVFANSNFTVKPSKLIPYTLIDDSGLVIELSDNKARFIVDDGLLLKDDEDVVSLVSYDPFKVIISGDNACQAGDQFYITGPGVLSSVANKIFVVSSFNVGTLSLEFLASVTADDIDVSLGISLKKVVTVATPYANEDVLNVRYQQNQDVMDLYCVGYRNQRLTRNSLTGAWSIAEIEYLTGPFMPAGDNGVLLLEKSGGPIPSMTSNTLPSGTVTSSSAAVSHPAWHAFDDNPATYWESSGENQKGTLQYQFAAAQVIVGYTLYPARQPDTNIDPAHPSTDYAPTDWTFDASTDGITWVTLDTQKGYLLYDNGRSVHFKFRNTIAYAYYRLKITQLRGTGAIPARLQQLMLTDAGTASRTMYVYVTGAYPNLNSGQGFLSTDVDRLLRLKGYDGNWRVMQITQVDTPTQIKAILLDEPFLEFNTPVREYQLGYFSDTLGWPNFGTFYEDRKWVAGLTHAPGVLFFSRTGSYDDFAAQTSLNEVLDTSAAVLVFNTRKRSSIRWLSTDERGVIMGMGKGIVVLQSSGSSDSAITPRNIKARPSTERGTANIEPAKIDRQHLYIPTTQTQVNEIAYRYEVDGYEAPNMSVFASHLGTPKFVEIAEQEAPYNLVWVRRADGSMVSITYYRDQKVVGWHRHDFGGAVESYCVIPDKANGEDKLVMVIKRNGVRHIVSLMPFWNFGHTLDTAWFVDFGLRYEGALTDTVSGLEHLEGQTVSVLADGVAYLGLTVTGGDVKIPNKARNILVGIGYEQLVVRPDLNAGRAQGSPQGKVKRVSLATMRLWDSAGGEFGVVDRETGEAHYDGIDYPEEYTRLPVPALYSGLTSPMTVPGGYDRECVLSFRQQQPLPLNVIAVYADVKGSES